MKANGLQRKRVRVAGLMCMFHAAIAVGTAGLLVAAGFILGSQLPGGLAPQIEGNTGGTERYLTHVSTDKPIYRTGEKVYVRAVVLHAITHYPVTNPGT